MDEEKLRIFLNSEASNPEELKKIIASYKNAGNKKAEQFWTDVYNATGGGIREIKDPVLKKLSKILNESGTLSVIPPAKLKNLYSSSTPVSQGVARKDYTKKDPVKDIIDNPILTPKDSLNGKVNVPAPDKIVKETVAPKQAPVPPPKQAPSLPPVATPAPAKANVPPAKDSLVEPLKNTPKDQSNNGTTYKSTKAIYNREDPNKKALDELNKKVDPKIGELTKSLKESGFKSLSKQAEDWEKSYDVLPDNTNAARRESLNYFLQDFKDTLGPLVDVIDFVEQRRQTKEAGRIADESMRNAPTAPAIRGENKMLGNLIRQNQIAYSNPNQMIQPYMDQVNLGYQQDLAQAQELSGGQAGNAMALGQAASIRRNRANAEAAPMTSKLFQEGILSTGGLIGQQMQDDTWRDQQNIDLYKTANANNQNLQQVAGMGLAASRARELQARNNMLDSMLTSPAFDVDTYMNYTRSNLINPPRI